METTVLVLSVRIKYRLGVLPLSEEAYLANISTAWARLAAYYYRDKPLQSTTRAVKKKNALRQRMLANRRAAETESEDEQNQSDQIAQEPEE